MFIPPTIIGSNKFYWGTLMNLIAVQGSIFKEVSIVQLTKRIMFKGKIINHCGGADHFQNIRDGQVIKFG